MDGVCSVVVEIAYLSSCDLSMKWQQVVIRWSFSVRCEFASLIFWMILNLHCLYPCLNWLPVFFFFFCTFLLVHCPIFWHVTATNCQSNNMVNISWIYLALLCLFHPFIFFSCLTAVCCVHKTLNLCTVSPTFSCTDPHAIANRAQDWTQQWLAHESIIPHSATRSQNFHRDDVEQCLNCILCHYTKPSDIIHST